MATPATPPLRAADPAEHDTYAVGMLVVKARRRMRAATVRNLEAAGESFQAWQVIAHLAREGAITQGALATGIACDPAGISRSLDGLEKQGIVKRTRGTEDRRRVTVELTAAGRRRVAKLQPLVTAGIEETLAPLDGREREQLAALLGKCLAG
jgi:DNA-binding MarR family transcriptional regulator